MTPRKSGRKVLYASAAVILGLGAGLAVAEVGVRLLAPQVPYHYGLYYNWWRWDPLLGTVLRPSHRTIYVQPEFRTSVVTNSLGFRELEFPIAKEAGLTRILSVGDSFTFGFGVEAEDTWPKVLERELKSRSRRNVQVINAGGASGFSPSPYYFFIKRNLAKFNPDIVVLGLTAHNDIVDETRYQWGELGEDSLPLWGKFSGGDAVNARGMRATTGEDAPLRYRLPIISHSHLARLAGRALGSLIKAGGDVQSQSYLREYPEELKKALMRVNHLIRGLNAELRQRGVKLAVLVIPSIPQVDPREDPISLGYFPPGRGREDMDYGRPQSLLIPEFRKNAVFFVDPRPEISEAVKAGMKIYYRYDGHWTKEGHALAGKLLAERLFPKN